MKRINVLSLLVLIIILTNRCVVEKTQYGTHMYFKANTIITPTGYVVTKGRFKFKDAFQLKDTQTLSPTCLYMRKGDSTNWLKFYEDGRVLYSIGHKVPRFPADQFGAWGGYYQLNGNNIKIELTYTQKYNIWYKLGIEGKMAGDTLKFYKDDGINHFTSNSYYSKDSTLFYYFKVAYPHLLNKPDF